tara:strand:+ start:269 stop:784 length:516 start_codon:yes stop_codon:yes gene_type:complete
MSKLIWITGLAGSGKTSIGKEVFKKLKKLDPATAFIDGDNYRELFNSYGYSREDRLEIAKKIIKLCYFLTQQNINVVCCTISLFNEIHEENRKLFDNYYEIYISCKMEELVRRDQKNLYSKALAGEINNVVGVDIDFDIPKQPFLSIDNSKNDALNINIILICKKIFNETR